MNEKYGQRVNEAEIAADFLSGPGQFLVKRTLAQMAKVPPFVAMFGPYRTTGSSELAAAAQAQRWSDYARYDWSVRQLPAISVYEAETETKESSSGPMNGTVGIQVFWPANLRRSDLARVPNAFKGAIVNFFESESVTQMLDEHHLIERPEKVPGLKEFGRSITWSPNVEGIIENTLVPVTMLSVRYRIDMGSWYRYLELDGRSRARPFERQATGPVTIQGEYEGVAPRAEDVHIRVKQRIDNKS